MTETLLSQTVRRLFAGGGAVGLTLLALPVVAPAQETPGAPKPVARVEVTGTNIRRAQSETASSVLVVNRADIEKSGKATVAELLQTLAVDNQGSVPVTFGNGFAAGASGISLRGLGAASTLVLLNGRRIAPYGLADDGQKQFADLNVIPSDAVERVEILKDGASAIYGSDAIAGVVNIILRRDFRGTTARASYGKSGDWDGTERIAAISHGFGDLDTDRFNALFTLEYKKIFQINYRDRDDREWIGKNDLRRWGYSANQGLGGAGAILGRNNAGSAINGNVRNPGDPSLPAGDDPNPNRDRYFNRGNPNGADFTRVFPAAACPNFTSHPQGDPGGGCLVDASALYNQVQPKQENLSLFGRFAWQVTPNLEAYSELNWYTSTTNANSSPSTISASVGSPAGAVSNAGSQFGAEHPDNPYFGLPARLRYLAADVGERKSRIDSVFVRWIGGARGTHFGWDWDSALLFSHNNVWNKRRGFLQRDVAFALLDPSPGNVAAATANSPAYAALPPGTFWRIAENAGLNSPQLYEALAPAISSRANSKVGQLDFKASREFMQLPGGRLGVATGAEFRHEMTQLRPVTGTERGNIIGLGFSAYDGSRNAVGLYGEALAPVWRGVELTGAVRWDHYTDVGNSWTPKAGVKWNPIRALALRATWARGFRAPSPAENGRGGLAAFATAEDPVRCALGVEGACDPASVAVITSPNPNLSPERSSNWNLGVIWDPLPRTSVSLDFWQVKRRNEINQEQIDAAIVAGHVARDPSTSTGPGDPGAITAVLANYVNSSETKVRGIDIDARQGWVLPPGWGSFIVDVKYTHLYKWLRVDPDGTRRDFAGSHGNCDVTNCIGTARNRANLHATWERPSFRATVNVNFRGPIQNRLFNGDPDCAVTFDDGSPAPKGCELASFTTFDLVLRWKPRQKWEVFGSVQNLADRIAPLDPLTYGAQSYNPLDYEGAVGRFYTVGARYTF